MNFDPAEWKQSCLPGTLLWTLSAHPQEKPPMTGVFPHSHSYTGKSKHWALSSGFLYCNRERERFGLLLRSWTHDVEILELLQGHASYHVEQEKQWKLACQEREECHRCTDRRNEMERKFWQFFSSWLWNLHSSSCLPDNHRGPSLTSESRKYFFFPRRVQDASYYLQLKKSEQQFHF